MTRESRNRFGGAYGLTVMHPILPGQDVEVAALLDAIPDGDASPLARVPGTHVARWVVMSEVFFQGAGQRRRDSWTAPRLLFTSNFDGDLDPYLESLRTSMPAEADEIWGHCQGYPGSGDAVSFRSWFRSHQIENSLFFAAYGDLSVAEVHRAVEARSRLMSFALEAQGLPADELQTRFRETFT